jgi:hypothetical protein
MWSSSYYDRALRILPPLVIGQATHRSTPLDNEARTLRLARVACRCDLLVASRRLCEAVQLRLAVAVHDGILTIHLVSVMTCYHMPAMIFVGR